LKYWVWVFGEIEGLRWVQEHSTMAFTDGSTKKLTHMHEGDRAVLYVTKGAHHNPTRDVSRLVGLATVVDRPQLLHPVEIAGRPFSWFCPIETDVVLPDRTGPVVSSLIARLELVRNQNSWGGYFRRSPIQISHKDFEVFERALDRHRRGLVGT
jgi:hypothetical protein